MFDPYHKWLGIPPGEQPPSHYRLLGIALFEHDDDVISNAADRVMAHLRTFQAGKQAVESQQLLNEASAARLCLLNPAKRSEYDANLRAAQSPAVQPPVVALPVARRVEAPKPKAPLRTATPNRVATSVPVALQPALPPGEEESADADLKTPARPQRRVPSKPPVAVLATVGICLVGTLLGGIMWLTLKSDKVPPATAEIGERRDHPTPSHFPTPSAAQRPASPRSAASQVQPWAHLLDVNWDEQSSLDDEQRKRIIRNCSGLNALMYKAYDQANWEHSGTESRMKASPRRESWGPSKSFLVGFTVELFSGKVVGYRPIFAIAFGDSRVELHHGGLVGSQGEKSQRDLAKFGYAVGQVSVSQNDAVLGFEATYMRITAWGLDDRDHYKSNWLGTRSSEPLVTLGNGLPIARVSSQMDYKMRSLAIVAARVDNRPSSTPPKVVQVPVAPQPTPKPVAPIAKLESRGLPRSPEPKSSVPDLDTEEEPELPMTRRPRSSPPPQPVAKRKPIPKKSELAEARREVHRRFGERMAKAKTAADRHELGVDMYQAAKYTSDGDATRYYLFEQACELIAAAGDPDAIKNVIVTMASHFEIDDVEITIDSLQLATKSNTTDELKRRLAEMSLELADKAIERDRIDAAKRLISIGKLASAKLKDERLTDRLNDRLKTIRLRDNSVSRISAAKAKLERDADDPEANLIVGRALCFDDADWEAGLPLLAKCGAERYRAAAAAELAPAPDVDAKIAIGDLWNEVLESNTKWQQQAKDRAIYWYREALPELSGLSKIKVQKRIDAVDEENRNAAN